MTKAGLLKALTLSLEPMHRGADLGTALAKHPQYRVQLRALREVASLIRPLTKDVVPSQPCARPSGPSWRSWGRSPTHRCSTVEIQQSRTSYLAAR